MEEKILKILKDINDEIIDYTGEDLYKDGFLDSMQVIELVIRLEEIFDIEINPELVVVENFSNKDTIIKFVKDILGDQNVR